MNRIDEFRTPRAVSPQLQRIIQTIGQHYVAADMTLRRDIFQKAFTNGRHEPVQITIAEGFVEFLRRKQVCLNPYDVLAGHIQAYDHAWTTPIHVPPERLTPRGLVGKGYIYKIYPELEKFLETAGLAESSVAYQDMMAFKTCWENKLVGRYVTGHVIAGYERVVRHGLGTLLEEARQYDNVQAQAARIVLQGASDYILRYADRADSLSALAGPEENRQQMRRLAQCCRTIAVQPPASFLEGVQLVWLVHEMLLCEAWPSSHSLGRLDKILQPLYDTDYNKGALTYAAAQDYIFALWIKFAAWPRIFQNITLGGATAHEPFLCGEVSRMCLNATRVLRFDQPQLSIRVNDQIPEDFLDDIVDTLAQGGGFPALFNDEPIIKAKTGFGISREDALDYGIIGCVETGICGKEYSNTEALRLNYGKIMELFLSGGIHYGSGDRTAMHLPDHFDSFEQLYACFLGEADRLLELALKCTVLLEPVFGRYWPNPFLSATMDGPLQSGLDASAGGARYPYSTANAIGIANAANSLAAIKKLVFDEGRYTLKDIKHAIALNFEGTPALYNALSGCPKFGNDLDEVDGFVADITRSFVERVCAHTNHWGNPFQPGLYSVDYHATMGMQTGALPDGHKAGTALQNGFSPVQGTDVNGPTAVINSVCKTDFSKIGNGMVLDLKFSPTFFESSRHRTAFKALIRTYFRKGGLELQCNVVDRQTLLDAQRQPELYPDLIVRVSGFSAYFTALQTETQDEIIQRTELSAS
jgi:formate C-acetyltransferase